MNFNLFNFNFNFNFESFNIILNKLRLSWKWLILIICAIIAFSGYFPFFILYQNNINQNPLNKPYTDVGNKNTTEPPFLQLLENYKTSGTFNKEIIDKAINNTPSPFTKIDNMQKMGTELLAKKEYDSALEYYQMALKNSESIKYDVGIFNHNINVADALFKKLYNQTAKNDEILLNEIALHIDYFFNNQKKFDQLYKNGRMDKKIYHQLLATANQIKAHISIKDYLIDEVEKAIIFMNDSAENFRKINKYENSSRIIYEICSKVLESEFNRDTYQKCIKPMDTAKDGVKTLTDVGLIVLRSELILKQVKFNNKLSLKNINIDNEIKKIKNALFKLNPQPDNSDIEKIEILLKSIEKESLKQND